MASGWGNVVSEIWDTSKDVGQKYLDSKLKQDEMETGANAGKQQNDQIQPINPVADPNIDIFGLPVNKMALYITGAAIGLVMLVKVVR